MAYRGGNKGNVRYKERWSMKDVFPIHIYQPAFMQRSGVFLICASKRRKSSQGLRTGLQGGFPSTFQNIKMYIRI